MRAAIISMSLVLGVTSVSSFTLWLRAVHERAAMQGIVREYEALQAVVEFQRLRQEWRSGDWTREPWWAAAKLQPRLVTGLTQDEVRSLLGEPDQVFSDGDWSYDLGASKNMLISFDSQKRLCALDWKAPGRQMDPASFQDWKQKHRWKYKWYFLLRGPERWALLGLVVFSIAVLSTAGVLALFQRRHARRQPADNSSPLPPSPASSSPRSASGSPGGAGGGR